VPARPITWASENIRGSVDPVSSSLTAAANTFQVETSIALATRTDR
jgi:hypothetical protein